MSRDGNLTQTAHGSYVQLNTFDEKENEFVQTKSSYPSLVPYQRCLCIRRDIIIIACVSVISLILITTSIALGLPKIQEKKQKYLDVSFSESSSPLLSYNKAVVVTDGSQCADIAKNILLKGGSAVDAALAALFCGGVVNPHSMGFGGGFLMTVYTRKNKTSEVIDAREVAPKNASKNMFEGNSTLSLEGGLSIAVPGELQGYWAAFEKYGNLSWRELIEPSIELCTHGFKVSSHLAKHLHNLKEKILSDDSLKKEFYNNETNDVYKEGEILKRPILGITLNEVADKGPNVLYTGDLHQSFLEDIQNCGGIISETDLADYKPLIKPAVKIKLDVPESLSVHSVPPPGSGLILSLILNILSNYNMTSEDFEDIDNSVLMYHRIVEAFKFAFAHRTQMGDDAFVNITELISNLQSKRYADSLWKQISDKTHEISYYKPVMETSNDHGTAHVSVVSENGDAVSVTSSINTHFGSLCRSPQTGIILNSAMDDFSAPNVTNYFGVPPSPANYIVPGKRPLSSMCPTIVVNDEGDVHMVVGGAGGTRIITSSVMAIIRTLWLGEDIKKATDAPRIHHQLFPNTIQHEREFPKIYLDKLKETYGHSSQVDLHASVFLGIIRDGEKLSTNVDYRKGGSASGY